MSENQRPDSDQADSADKEVPNPLQEAQQYAEKMKNDFLYLKAEFENYKRNSIKERSELIKYGAERLLVDLLGVLDNFERALETKATPENLASYAKGVEMTATELRALLQKFGVTEVASLGKNFDPFTHEALSSEETYEFEPGQVSRVFKKPYKLHDKVIRPGQVVVAKKPTAP